MTHRGPFQLQTFCDSDSHVCAFADSGEHHELEDSPEGAWGTASHHGRADLQFRHERRIPPAPQSWSHQWKLASAHWEGQVSSGILSRWSVTGWEVCLQKRQLSNPTDQMCESFLAFLCLLFSMEVDYLGSKRARRKLGKGSERLPNSW